jgi:hypothetical protein
MHCIVRAPVTYVSRSIQALKPRGDAAVNPPRRSDLKSEIFDLMAMPHPVPNCGLAALEQVIVAHPRAGPRPKMHLQDLLYPPHGQSLRRHPPLQRSRWRDWAQLTLTRETTPSFPDAPLRGSRVQIGMVAPIKSECLAGMLWNPQSKFTNCFPGIG